MTSEVGLLRLAAQGLIGPREPDAAGVVRRLTAVQAQDLPGALTSVALRSADRTRAGVVAALDAGIVVRSWPMRGTLHLTAAEDLPWMLELLAPRVLAGAASRRADRGITDAEVERARELVVSGLAGGGRLRRGEVLALLADGGVPTTGQRGYHLLWHLSQTGTLCLGPMAGDDQLFVLLDEWVGQRRRLERDEALRELALRFFTGHGPATVADLARWAGVPVRDARTGLAQARDRLERLSVAGDEHWLDPATPGRLAAAREEAEGVLLLPGFDELVLGYADRTCTVPAEFADRVVPGGNGMFRATVVSGGRAVATWRAGRGRARALEVEPFTGLTGEVEAGARAAYAALP